MATANHNCWEVLECKDMSNCPAYPDNGKMCWEVQGTLCRGERQGEYHDKVGDCRTLCKFFHAVIMGKS